LGTFLFPLKLLLPEEEEREEVAKALDKIRAFVFVVVDIGSDDDDALMYIRTRDEVYIIMRNSILNLGWNWKIQRGKLSENPQQIQMKLSIAFLLAFWYPIFLSLCFTGLYCYCCNPCASFLGRKRKKKAPLLPK